MNSDSTLPEGFKMRFDTSPYHYFPRQLKILSDVRENSHLVEDTIATNLLTITSCTAFIETILFESMDAVIAIKSSQESDKFILSILTKIQKDISSATFRSFEQISEDFLGKPLNQFTSKHTWEAIKILFALRNQIIHGKKLSIEYIYDGNILNGHYGKNYDPIIKFMIKKGFITTEDINMSSLFADAVAMFFVKITKQFFLDVTKNISAEFNTITYQGFEHMRKDLSAL